MISRIPILLLADDGKMARLLRSNNANGNLQTETSIVKGIMGLGRKEFELVMLNAEKSGYNTTEAVKSIRKIAPDCKILLYGPAYAEIYARSALQEGASDFLVWPIPAQEIRQYIFPKAYKQPGWLSGRQELEKREPHQKAQQANKVLQQQASKDTVSNTDNRTSNSSNNTDNSKVILQALQELPLLTCKGVADFIEKAQSMLADVLQREWVRIEPAFTYKREVSKNSYEENETNTKTGAANSYQAADEKQLYTRCILPGLDKPSGEILLGPPKGKADDTAVENARPGSSIDNLNTAINYVGRLLYLAHRDEQLRHLVMTDGLTGARNRRYLETFTNMLLEQGRRDKAQLTLLLFDIDNFKHYNDTYGHMAGDEILRESIKMIKRCCREHDIVARVGGDEFAVLFWDKNQHQDQLHRQDNNTADTNGTTVDTITNVNVKTTDQNKRTNKRSWRSHPETVMFLSNRIRRLMQTNEFPSLGSEARGVLTISGGLASYPVDGKTFKQLIARADEALLAAKRDGKNHIYIVGQPKNISENIQD